MTRDPADDFDDPTEPEAPLRANVLYRIARSARMRVGAVSLRLNQFAMVRCRHW
jgi:hypothetical protein